jgi:hypothetical protein
VGEALIRVVVGSVLSGIAAVVLGVVLKPPAMHTGSADAALRVEHSRISGTVRRDKYPLRATIETQAPDDRVRAASLEPHVGLDAVTNEPDGVANASDAVTSQQVLLEPVPASGWWNESFDERFPGLATQELPSDVDFLSPSDDDSRTAIYDIAARTVYLPNGRRLEAHSGLGGFIDDPHRVHVKDRGATPPNVYNLSMRKRLFHGVRAIRLTPADESKMFGRDGMLAHSYLHGPNGQSKGCVAFKNYPEFLNAFLKGEVTRLVVVRRLETPPAPKIASSDRVGQYAAAD